MPISSDDDVSNIFTARQIDEFKKIYTFKPLQDSFKKEKKSSMELEKQDDGTYLKKLQNPCCQKQCTIKVDVQEALKRYREIKAKALKRAPLFSVIRRATAFVFSNGDTL